MKIPIYVREKAIYLTDEPIVKGANNCFALKEISLKEILRLLKRRDVQVLFLHHHKADKLLSNFRKKVKTVVAGGGRVSNIKGEVLFIYRNKKWDLPKGRIERNETIEEGALREVKEETGVKKLKLQGEIGPTYHLFKGNGETKLKITYWFEMSTTYTGSLSPEKAEGITKAVWLGEEQMKKASAKSYANIASLLKQKIKLD